MQIKKIAAQIVFITFLYNCDSTVIEKSNPKILPIPAHLQSTEGEFILDNSVGMAFDDKFSISATFPTFH